MELLYSLTITFRVEISLDLYAWLGYVKKSINIKFNRVSELRLSLVSICQRLT